MGTVQNTYYLEVYGCQMNKAEADALELELKNRGWKSASGPEYSDLTVIHTCYIRKTAEDRIWGRLGFYRSLKARGTGPGILAVMGCMKEAAGTKIKQDYPEVDILVPTFSRNRFADLLNRAEAELTRNRRSNQIYLQESSHYHFSARHAEEGRFKAFVPIMHGCNNFCSYCIVPYVRGREISRDIDGIIDEIRVLDSQGVKEITLLGQNVNSYRYPESEDGINFPELLRRVSENTDSIRWIRFLTSHPKDFCNDLISLIEENPKICSHIHLPVQHGSNRILQLMNRRYTAEQYKKIVDTIKEKVPNATFSTDLLIGFPGETEEDLVKTIDLMKYVKYQDAFTYRYNPREGTASYKWGDTLTEQEKLERLSRVIELQKQISRDERQKWIGRTSTVLVEGLSKKDSTEVIGRNENDCMIVFPGTADLTGTFRKVEISALAGNTLQGKELVTCRGN
ncbi:MAG: tRNA (N6-isopentenyl adenosine(37)-C2)-methylthiotransferase MiaB [Spirochaetia bacterium]